MLAVVDWTNVLDTLIASAPAIIAAVAAAVYGRKIHQQIQLPSGKAIGDAMEFTHDTAIANNLLLSKHNGPTKKAEHTELVSSPDVPQIPVEHGTDNSES